MMSEYETFVLKGLSDLKENEDMEINIRSLEPGRYKYEARIVKAKVSSSPDKHPDKLWIRFQKGQRHPDPWSIEIIEEVNKIPEEFI
jgi:phenylphosphate carboxylase gamma subunit